MDITNFDRVRVGGGYPSSLDVFPSCGHEHEGVYAEANTYKDKTEHSYIQFRVHNSLTRVALFTFRYEEQEVPEHWKDSTVIYDSRKQSHNG